MRRALTSVSARLLGVLLLLFTFGAAVPAPAFAAQDVAELTAAADRSSNDLAVASARLDALDAQIAETRVRLASVESRLPASPRQEAAAVAAAVGSVFSPKLLTRAEGIASDERARGDLREQLDRLTKERGRREQTVSAARLTRDQDAARLAEALRAEADKQRAEADRQRAEQIVAFGLFPVAGPNEFVDSWGFARSGGRAHKGTDILAARGTPVVAVHDGWAAPGSNGLGGLTVWLTGDDGRSYYYAHLDSIAVGEGRVVAGQVLGAVGDSGNARGTAPHLHFEIHEPGPVDPYAQLLKMVR